MHRFALAVFVATIAIGIAIPATEEIHLAWLKSQNPAAYDPALPTNPPPEPGLAIAIAGAVLSSIVRFEDHAGLGFLWSALLLVPVILLSERILGRRLRSYIIGSAVAAAASTMMVIGLYVASDGEREFDSWFYFKIATTTIIGMIGALSASIALSANKSLERARGQ